LLTAAENEWTLNNYDKRNESTVYKSIFTNRVTIKLGILGRRRKKINCNLSKKNDNETGNETNVDRLQVIPVGEGMRESQDILCMKIFVVF